MIAPQKCDPRRDGRFERWAARTARLMPRQRLQPALRNLLAAVHRDLEQPMIERGIGEAIEQRIGIGRKILPRRGLDRRSSFIAHPPFDERTNLGIGDGLKIGRASGRERVCQYVWNMVVGGLIKNKMSIHSNNKKK